jgi:hypothetical protein
MELSRVSPIGRNSGVLIGESPIKTWVFGHLSFGEGFAPLKPVLKV